MRPKDVGGINKHCAAVGINPLSTELNPICHLLALLEAHHILHVSGPRVRKYRCNVVVQKMCNI
jgi:transposase